MRRIHTRTELIELARRLGTRPDWHEPDEQELTAVVEGNNFDNAGFWPSAKVSSPGVIEQHVMLFYQEGNPVGAVNLATLFAWATGYETDTTDDIKVRLQITEEIQRYASMLRASEDPVGAILAEAIDAVALRVRRGDDKE